MNTIKYLKLDILTIKVKENLTSRTGVCLNGKPYIYMSACIQVWVFLPSLEAVVMAQVLGPCNTHETCMSCPGPALAAACIWAVLSTWIFSSSQFLSTSLCLSDLQISKLYLEKKMFIS